MNQLTCNIAGLNIALTCKDGRTKNQAIPYLTTSEEVDFEVKVPAKKEVFFLSKYPELSQEDAEYILTGQEFCTKLLEYNGMMLHSSAVVLDGKAYLFSANCGVGKSTHTSLWVEHFGSERAYILNDDKPIIRKLEDGKFYVYGTPWSGKHDISVNAKVPLQGITFLKQGKENAIRRLSLLEAIPNLLQQTQRTTQKDSTELTLKFLNELLMNYEINELTCDISREAVQVSYQFMSK